MIPRAVPAPCPALVSAPVHFHGGMKRDWYTVAAIAPVRMFNQILIYRPVYERVKLGHGLAPR